MTGVKADAFHHSIFISKTGSSRGLGCGGEATSPIVLRSSLNFALIRYCSIFGSK